MRASMEHFPKTNKAKAELRKSHRPLLGCSFPFQRAPEKRDVSLSYSNSEVKQTKPHSACCIHSCNPIRDFFSPLYFLFSSFLPLSPLPLPSSLPSPLSSSHLFFIFNFPFYFASERCWWHYSLRLHFRAVTESCELKVSKTVIQTLCSSSCSVWCKIRKNSWQGLHTHSIPSQLMTGNVLLGETLHISSHSNQLAKKAGPCYAKSLFVNSVLPLNWF